MHRRPALEGGGHIHHRRQFLEIEMDLLGRVAGRGKRLRDHGHHRIADMADLARSQDRMHRLAHRLAVAVDDLPAAGNAPETGSLDIGTGENPQHAGHGRRGGRIDGPDPAVRDGRPEKADMGLTVAVDVIGIGAAPGQEADILASLDRDANPVLLCAH